MTNLCQRNIAAELAFDGTPMRNYLLSFSGTLSDRGVGDAGVLRRARHRGG